MEAKREKVEGLIVALLVWIAGEARLEVPPAPPVVLVGQERLSELLYGDGAVDGAERDTRGLYDRDDGIVYLRSDWHDSDVADRAALLHELVHHAQIANDVPYECPAQLERQAYHLTIKWLQQQGIADPYAMLKTNELTIAVRSMCAESADS